MVDIQLTDEAVGYVYELVIRGPYGIPIGKTTAANRIFFVGIGTVEVFANHYVFVRGTGGQLLAQILYATDHDAQTFANLLLSLQAHYAHAAPTAPLTPGREALRRSGTGFFINPAGYLLTNYHVIEECPAVVATLRGQEVLLTRISDDPQNDLAVLQADGPPTPFLALRDGPGIRAGDPVVAMGFPLAGILAREANITTGTVSALAGLGNDTRFFQITVPVQLGSSGSPLLDHSGHVVGIITGKLNTLTMARTTGDIPQNVNFALHARMAEAFLATQNIAYTKAPSHAELQVADMSAAARDALVLLECRP
jgi:S1-C subfamily serine protease